MNLKELFKSGVWTNNPVLIQILGLCPVLATSSTLLGALVMGLSATVVLMCSNVVISLLRKLIPEKIRIAVYVLIIACFVSIIEMLLKAYLSAVYSMLGIFVPLIVANCMVLARAENFASKNQVLPSLLDGLFMGIGFTLVLSVLGLVRETLGSGTIFGISIFGGAAPLAIFALPAGSFLALGFVVALAQHLLKKSKGGDKS